MRGPDLVSFSYPKKSLMAPNLHYTQQFLYKVKGVAWGQWGSWLSYPSWWAYVWCPWLNCLRSLLSFWALNTKAEHWPSSSKPSVVVVKSDSQGHCCHQQTYWAYFYALAKICNRKSWQLERQTITTTKNNVLVNVCMFIFVYNTIYVA